MPSAWDSYDALYRRIRNDPEHFRATLIATPYHHSTFGDNLFHDGGMASCFEQLGYPYLKGRDDSTGEWLDLRRLEPDYVFYQVPYNEFYPEAFHSCMVSAYAMICYSPYYGVAHGFGNNGGIYPEDFFSTITHWFICAKEELDEMTFFRPSLFPFVSTRAHIVGFLRHETWREFLSSHPPQKKGCGKTFLWTPRWETKGGICHFLLFQKALMNLVETHSDFHLILRPHPLMFQNLRQTGELPEREYLALRDWFDRHENAEIDDSGNYNETFLRADVLISDSSSMLANWACTGKPIIHTESKGHHLRFFGATLAPAFYQTHSLQELLDRILSFLRGEDPLVEKRAEVISSIFPKQNASENICRCLLYG